MKRVSPYGSWQSALTAERVAAGATKLAFPLFTSDGQLTWLESRPSEGGRAVVVGTRGDLSPPSLNARNRVHEMGGRSHLFIGPDLWLVHQGDGGLYRIQPGRDAELVGTPSRFRLAEPTHDPERARLVCVGELHPALGGQAENGIVAVDLATGATEWLVRGHDFFAFPTPSPDGRELAFLAWDFPHMPWDRAALFVAAVAADGAIGPPQLVAGGPGGSAFCPIWSPAGELYFALEHAGASWNLHRRRHGRVELVLGADEEWGAPLWNLGTTLFAFCDERHIVGAPMRAGLSRLVRVDVESGASETVVDGLGHVGHLVARGDEVLLTQGWAGSGTRVVHVALESGVQRVVKDAMSDLFAGPSPTLVAADVPEAEPVRFPTSHGDEAHAFFYAPASSREEAPPGTLPPLVVLCHGGPTGVAAPLATAGILQFTTRGFAVLDVNYRGSVGFGRDYREKLRGRWGDVDVDDCVYGARAMAERGKVDGLKLAIRGGSAGGFTLLLALARHPKVFTVATCLYGVSDPRALTAATHKFESTYDHALFGTGDEREQALDERSPVALAHLIETPTIFFHGLEDKVVVPEQSARIHEALRARGVMTELHTYAGEQHGFRKAETVRDIFEKEAAFYQRAFARTPERER